MFSYKALIKKYAEPQRIAMQVQGYTFDIGIVPYNDPKGTKRLSLLFRRPSYNEPYQRREAWYALKDRIKFELEGSQFVKDPPQWVCPASHRNLWTLNYYDLSTPDPYLEYYAEPPDFAPTRPQAKDYQALLLKSIAHTKSGIIAAEMGMGKTLVTMMLMEAENIPNNDIWYIAPKFALKNIKLEFQNIWKSTKFPLFMNYDEMGKQVRLWPKGKIAPQMVIFDESAMIKHCTSARSQYAKQLADGMREDHDYPYIICLSGAPAPRTPVDFWHQCEVTNPGFLKERDPSQLRDNLALVIKEEGAAGGTYPHVITFFDNPAKCKHCGQLPNDLGVPTCLMPIHAYEPSENKVARLHRRLKGIVFPLRKKDWLSLPDKVYREINIDPAPSLIRAAKMLVRSSPTTIAALQKLRELSDGFQYTHVDSLTSYTKCIRCEGTGLEFDPTAYVANATTGVRKTCTHCEGSGVVPAQELQAKSVPCPKDGALADLLLENEEIGRIVIYAGFTASIDRVQAVCIKNGWQVIRADGKSSEQKGGCMYDGMWCSTLLNVNPLLAFQDKTRQIPKLAFVAHPLTAKTSLTLTEAQMLVYYSNTFNGDDRIQSEDRIHRLGMDENRAPVIVDLLHLPSDRYVLNNLKRKVVLQDVSLGALAEGLADYFTGSFKEGLG